MEKKEFSRDTMRFVDYLIKGGTIVANAKENYQAMAIIDDIVLNPRKYKSSASASVQMILSELDEWKELGK